MQDQNLIYQPCYRLKDDDFLMQIGPRVISFVNVNVYIGWDKFYARIKKFILSIKQFESQMKFKRIGLRYVNFFEFDIFKRITLSVLMNGSTLTSNHLSLKAVLTAGEYQTNLNLINNVNMVKNGRQLNGSVVDIDTYLAKDSIDIYAKPDELIENAHTEEKILFFNLLNDDLIRELKPEYGEST